MRHVQPVRLKGLDLPRLVRAAQRDETRALNDLLGAIRPPLLRYFARRLPFDEAEDLSQIALIRITNALRRIDPDRADAFIARVAQNLVRTAYRTRQRELERYAESIDVDEIESERTTDAAIEWHDLAAAVTGASLRMLPQELREIVLSLLYGHSHAEIAERQGVSQITVRTRLLRARTVLRKELRECSS